MDEPTRRSNKLLQNALCDLKNMVPPDRAKDMLWALADTIRIATGQLITLRGPKDGVAALTVDEGIARFVEAYKQTGYICDSGNAFAEHCIKLLAPANKVNIERILMELDKLEAKTITDLPSLVKLLEDCEVFSKNPSATARDWVAGLRSKERTLDEFYALKPEEQAAVLLRFGLYAIQEHVGDTGLRMYDVLANIMRLDSLRAKPDADQQHTEPDAKRQRTE